MVTMRDAFGQALIELAGVRDDFVVLDADVAGGTGTNIFRDAYPERFIQCGIAEQNMMSLAAGLSTSGVIPVVTCYAVFASMRAVEQARNSIAYPNFNVKIVASHLGLDVGPDGPTHQAVEDVAIFRAIPNFRVVSPADPFELKSAIPIILDTSGPFYLRTGRSSIPILFDEQVKFDLGKGMVVREGNDVTIVAMGVMVTRAIQASEDLQEQGISCRVVNMSTLKPIDKELIVDSAVNTGAIVTAEDHNIYGGLGGAVAEVVVDCEPVPVERVGINDIFAESGEPDDLAQKFGLDSAAIRAAVNKVIKRKHEKK
ncbi:transketolase [Alkalispirochaeta odontotermitis]|nr:transketolase [Alkalispirochaeta odontotermitis]CAB1071321.1 Transketolase, C-terminal section (EC [Olavius algarvensis Delta 1 endosymbiont]